MKFMSLHCTIIIFLNVITCLLGSLNDNMLFCCLFDSRLKKEGDKQS